MPNTGSWDNWVELQTAEDNSGITEGYWGLNFSINYGEWPEIYLIEPKNGYFPGDTVTITGTGFTRRPFQLFFGALAETEPESWSNEQIIYAVPTDIAPGEIEVDLYNNGYGIYVNGCWNGYWILDEMSITDIDPDEAQVGDEVTISGSFPYGVTVNFNGHSSNPVNFTVLP